MHPFWQPVIEPALNACGAQTVVEIGAEQGRTTRLLVAWAAGRGATVHAIDPAPRFDTARWELEAGGRLRFHRARSLDVLGSIGAVDAALVDGDHNWYTVSGELRLLAAAAERAGVPLPLVIAHDVGWPYGRRDMYYDPASVPAEHRHDAARAGLLPGRSQLGSPGINAGYLNATEEGGPRNGVLTAIEDFAASHASPCELVTIEGLHGLGLLASRERLSASPGLAGELERLRSADFAREWAAQLEQLRIAAQMRASESELARARAERKLVERDSGLLDESDEAG
jgi:hypothetical protein